MFNKLSDHILAVMVIYTIIGLGWQNAERLIYDEIRPRLVDDFIALGITVLLYANFHLTHKNQKAIKEAEHAERG